MENAESGHYVEYTSSMEDMMDIDSSYFFYSVIDRAERILNSTYYSGERWVK